jgi:transcriptional regulator with XRE-family HTH domain
VAQYGRRIRAARGWRGISQKQLAEALGLDEQTVKRRESDKQDPKNGELIAIAQICQVPLSFLEHGFDAPVQVDDPLALILREITEHRERTEGEIGKRYQTDGKVFEKLDANYKVLAELQGIGRRLEQLLNPQRLQALDEAIQDVAGLSTPPTPQAVSEGEQRDRKAGGQS